MGYGPSGIIRQKPTPIKGEKQFAYLRKASLWRLWLNLRAKGMAFHEQVQKSDLAMQRQVQQGTRDQMLHPEHPGRRYQEAILGCFE